MKKANALPLPRIPDYDDSIIDKVDYDSNNVMGFIYYQNMSITDVINVFWDSSEIFNTTGASGSDTGAIEFQIKNTYLTNGTHSLQYIVTDIAGNQSRSDVMYIYVRNDVVAEHIIPPEVDGGSDGCLSTDEIDNNSGAFIHILPSETLNAYKGSMLYISWIEEDSVGRPVEGGAITYSTIIDDNVIHGYYHQHVEYNILQMAIGGKVHVNYYIEVGTERIVSETITLKIGTCIPDSLVLSLVTNQQNITANGIDTATITGTVNDSSTNSPQEGVDIYWSISSGGNITPKISTTGNNGEAKSQVTSLVPGTLTVRATIDNVNYVSLNIIAESSGLDYHISSLQSDQYTINADNSDKATLKCTVVDEYNIPASGIDVMWSADSGSLVYSTPSLTDQFGNAYAYLTTAQSGRIHITATLINNSSQTIEITSIENIHKTLKIMGERVVYNGFGRYRSPRLIALDDTSLIPIVANWSYADNTENKTGTTFFDTKADQVINVSAVGYDPVRINIANMTGNGSLIDDGIGPGSFSALTNQRKIISWGYPDYGGITPQQDSTYSSIFQNSHAFVAKSEISNKLLAWGSVLQGGSLPSDIAGRNDVVEVRGGFASMILRAESYPYIQTWGEIVGGDITTPQNIAAMFNIIKICTTANAFSVLDDTGHIHAWGSSACGGVLPAHIAQLNNIYDVFAAESAFAVLFGDGQVAAWGDEGNGGNESSLVGLKGIRQIYSTDSAFAAHFRDGTVHVWGNITNGGALPTVYENLSGVSELCSTYGAFAALKNDGTVISWGNPAYGGDSSSVTSNLKNIVCLSATGSAFAALKNDGTVITWGDSRDGGESSTISDKLHDILAIYGNTRAFAALRNDDTVICWGEKSSGSNSVPDELQGKISYLLK